MIARIAELEKELRLLDEKMEYLRRMTEDQRRDTAALAALEKEANPLLASVERVESMIKVIGKKLAEHIKLREAAQLAKQDAEDCVKVFGPAGVRAHILDTVTPFLNDRTAEYLSILSDGNINAIWTTLVRNKSGELREKFTIEVTNDKGGESFAALSGGEKRKVRLATVLALQDLVATRATKPIDLWIGDEIDDALDTAGLERLMTILERRARDRGTVLVISHNDLKDWCDQVAIVKKSGGYSKVEGALCD
jgi:DNA repair exonuclease SbcCD ATPase subunit